MADQTQWEKGKKWESPKCKGCGKEIEFIQLRNHKGEIKAHPVEADKNYMIMATGEKTEKGQYIYESRRVLTSHFSTCPAAAEFRGKSAAKKDRTADEIQKDIEKDDPADDKPPF